MALGDIAVSTGSACSSGSQAPSHVLQAIGAVGEAAGAVVRFGLGRGTTDEHIDFAIDRLTTVVRSLRRSTVASSVIGPAGWPLRIRALPPLHASGTAAACCRSVRRLLAAVVRNSSRALTPAGARDFDGTLC